MDTVYAPPRSELHRREVVLPEGNFFMRYWRGQKSLRFTFWSSWGFSVLFTLAVNLTAVAAPTIGGLLTFPLSIAFSVYIWVALWRAASNSKHRVGAIAVKIWVLIGVSVSVLIVGATIGLTIDLWEQVNANSS